MSVEISSSDDVIDSRNVIERIKELEHEAETHADENNGDEGLWSTDFPEDAEELAALKAFAAEGDDCFSDWPHGVTLVRDDYWEKYAQEYADDIGAIDRNAIWPCNHIDWEGAARELRYDYTGIDFDGVTYWGR